MAYTWTWQETGEPVYVSTAGGTLTLNLAGREEVSFDGEGRLVHAWLDRVTYRRALDNRVLAKRVRGSRWPRREYWFLETPQRRQVLERAYGLAARVADGLRHGRLDTGETPAPALETIIRWLEDVRGWTWERLEGERSRFYRVYRPVPILPPDQYLAVVLQATEGCSYNRCTFCTFYRGTPFRIKDPATFTAHAEAVKAFLGRGITMRRHLFLADANALVIPQHRLLPLMDIACRLFPVRSCGSPAASPDTWTLDGIYAFVSAPDVLRKHVADFRELRRKGLVRVYIGLETGHDPLRAFLLKEGTAADVLEAVRTVKAGGVSVGVIFMVGIGGDRYRERHFRDTVTVIQQMPLGAGDIVYLSPFVPSPEAPYVYDAAEAGIRPLSDAEMAEEMERFRAALRPWARPRGVRVSYYDIREFVY